MSRNNVDDCGTCLERKYPYPKNLEKKESSTWSFWKSKKNDQCKCDEPVQVQKEDPCKPKEDVCKPKMDVCVPPVKDDSKKGCPPMPPSDVPALCLPAWFTCPPKITVSPYPVPKGVDIRPISEGGRNSKSDGGKCANCGLDRPVSGPPKVNPKCPMVRDNPCGPAPEKKDIGLLKRITSFFGFGKEKADKK